MTKPPLLEARGISKGFPGVQALSNVDLRLERGEVVSVVGENGAGKSTLMKVLAGIHTPDAGDVCVEGELVPPGSVASALAAGIVLVHQELELCDNLDVAGNVFLGREHRRGPFLDEARQRRETNAVLRELDADFDAATPVSALSLGHRQLVEIAKALALKAKIVVLDEPTSSLTLQETEKLFAVVCDLRARGVGVLYISHRLGEVRELSDRVLVLRDGAPSGELKGADISHDAMVRLMVGRDLQVSARRPAPAAAEVVLELRAVRTRAWPGEAVSLVVRSGEKVGLTGLVGAGRTELLRAVFGIEARVGGDVLVAGKPLDAQHAREAIAAGVALVPEDRKDLALFLEDPVRTNLTLAALHRHHRLGWIEPGWEARAAKDAVSALNVKVHDVDVRVGTLSGGNQQKVVLARWLELSPRVLLLDEPTRGVDVGARQEIYELLDRLTDAGVAILFVSSEMEEVLGLADRLVVLRGGRVTGELDRSELTEEAVMTLATRDEERQPEAVLHA